MQRKQEELELIGVIHVGLEFVEKGLTFINHAFPNRLALTGNVVVQESQDFTERQPLWALR